MRTHLILLVFMFIGIGLSAQTVDELKEMQSEKKSVIADLQSKIDVEQSEIDDIQKEIDNLSGWKKGITGILGFDLNNSNGWIANPNPDASSSALNIGLSAFANRSGDKYFWNNKAVLTKSWQDVDLTEADSEVENDALFDNGTVDIFNLQSLYGYKLDDKLALSVMADLNTSVENFLSPGVLDLGMGITWIPSSNLTFVVHPFNYHLAFSGVEGVDTEGAVGTKLRADFNQEFNLSGKELKWTTTLMSFIPYQSKEPTLFEYTWLNTISFDLWKGIGLGIGYGLRKAKFESPDTQSYISFGLSYTI